MTRFNALLRKEVHALFSSPIAYAILTVFLVLMGYNFTTFLFINKTATLLHVFAQMALLLLLMLPFVTMRLFAEERKTGTLELLMTAPVREVEIVLAKFLASMSVVVVMIALSAAYPIVLGLYAAPDWGPIYGGYLGLLLLGAALVAIGLLVSAVTANQLVAAVVSLGVFLLLWMVETLGHLLPSPLDSLAVNVSLLAHFTPMWGGALFLTDIGFFISVTLLALFLGVRALARR
jgi:gliding motility-associated transport system permease protein